MRPILGVLLTAAMLNACGGGNSSSSAQPPPPPPSTVHLKASVSAIPGFQSFTTTVQAQAMPSVVMSGTYTGFCPSPFVSTQPTAIVFFGAGVPVVQTGGGQNCTNSGNFGGTGVTPGQGAANTAGASGETVPVIGSGTLSGFVATDSIRSVASGSQSGLAEVWIIRGGQAIPTGISCTIGSSNRCEDAVHTFGAQDGDGLVVTLTSQSGDALQNVQFFLGKQ